MAYRNARVMKKMKPIFMTIKIVCIIFMTVEDEACDFCGSNAIKWKCKNNEGFQMSFPTIFLLVEHKDILTKIFLMELS